MLRPAFRDIRLRFGRHDDAFQLPESARPVVLLGPNGSGKSTLVEGVVRTIFGYERRRTAEAARMDARRPWSGGEMLGEVTIQVRGEAIRVQREFATDRVRVESVTAGTLLFDGDGNPGATNQQARHYRRILTDLFGLSELDAYCRTLYIRQGDLPATTVGDHLLRLAAGGHARVDGARRDIAEAHRAVTRRPIHSAARAAINPRELEKVDEEVATVRARLAAAREAGERRGPLALERDRAADRLRALDDEIARLEEARSALARARALELEGRQLRDAMRRLESAARRVRDAAEEHHAAEDAYRDALRPGVYPADFPERIAAADLRWRDMQASRNGSARWPLYAAAGAAGVAALLAAAGELLFAAASGGVALLGLVAWFALSLDARRRHRAARAEVRRLMDGVPEPDGVSPATRSRHLAGYIGQRSAQARREDARAELATAAREARSLLRDSGVGTGPAAAPGRGLPRAAGLAERLHDAVSDARDRLARSRLDIERLGDASLGLPAAVPPTENDVAAALAERRAERMRLQNELQQVGQELLERGTPSESVAALEARLEELIPRREALDRKAAALEAAHALIADAYDAFRARDQDRLLTDVSRHAARLSGGVADGVEVSGSFEDVAVRLDGRLLPIETPPLSFGELHALLLAVRLGTADFLAGIGILPPLIVDEPFAHLDRGRAAATWDVLCAVAAERQVIVTTQDDLLLDHLGVDADLTFGVAAR